jgi:hypothetical protein
MSHCDSHSLVLESGAAAGVINCQQQPGLTPAQLWGLVHSTSTCTGVDSIGQEEEADEELGSLKSML